MNVYGRRFIALMSIQGTTYAARCCHVTKLRLCDDTAFNFLFWLKTVRLKSPLKEIQLARCGIFLIFLLFFFIIAFGRFWASTVISQVFRYWRLWRNCGTSLQNAGSYEAPRGVLYPWSDPAQGLSPSWPPWMWQDPFSSCYCWGRQSYTAETNNSNET